MFFTVFLLTVVIMVFIILGLGVQTFFSKKRRFPETRIGHNKELRKRKIYCPKTMQRRIDKGLDDSFSGCDGCY